MAIVDNAASDVLIITQTGTTRVKEIITEAVTKGVDEAITTKLLNKTIAETVSKLKNDAIKRKRKAITC